MAAGDTRMGNSDAADEPRELLQLEEGKPTFVERLLHDRHHPITPDIDNIALTLLLTMASGAYLIDRRHHTDVPPREKPATDAIVLGHSVQQIYNDSLALITPKKRDVSTVNRALSDMIFRDPTLYRFGLTTDLSEIGDYRSRTLRGGGGEFQAGPNRSMHTLDAIIKNAAKLAFDAKSWEWFEAGMPGFDFATVHPEVASIYGQLASEEELNVATWEHEILGTEFSQGRISTRQQVASHAGWVVAQQAILTEQFPIVYV